MSALAAEFAVIGAAVVAAVIVTVREKIAGRRNGTAS